MTALVLTLALAAPGQRQCANGQCYAPSSYAYASPYLWAQASALPVATPTYPVQPVQRAELEHRWYEGLTYNGRPARIFGYRLADGRVQPLSDACIQYTDAPAAPAAPPSKGVVIEPTKPEPEPPKAEAPKSEPPKAEPSKPKATGAKADDVPLGTLAPDGTVQFGLDRIGYQADVAKALAAAGLANIGAPPAEPITISTAAIGATGDAAAPSKSRNVAGTPDDPSLVVKPRLDLSQYYPLIGAVGLVVVGLVVGLVSLVVFLSPTPQPRIDA